MIDGTNSLSDYSKEGRGNEKGRASGRGTGNKLQRTSINPNQEPVRSNTDLNESTTIYGVTPDQINFMNFTQQYCVGFIDIINSTIATARINDPKKLRKYYSLFLNSMSAILNQYNGKIVKNSGDNLFFYFPKTSDHNNKEALQEVFDCSQSMFKSRIPLNAELLQEGLPSISYRISMDYGMVEVALSANNKEVDLFGSVVNECAKINSLSHSDSLSIGKGLYSILVNSGFGHEFEIKENKLPLSNNDNDDNLLLFYTLIDQRNKQALEGTTTSSCINDDSMTTTNRLLPITESKGKIFKILIVDDDEDILHTYRSLLKRHNYVVESFSSPVEALKHITEKKYHEYDLVIMDIRMPEVSGIKLFYMFKAIDPYIKILFITALDLVDEFVEVLPGISVNEIARKPLSEEQFMSIITKRLAEDVHK
jgi:CheY-like chemotaxis protein